MVKLLKSESISLKDNPAINEEMIRNFIYDNPNVLGIGDLISIEREKIQPTGGRLDLLLSDKNELSRYEVEIQLGATDPSHIIRTIEYWDVERKRYPQFDHCAVIIAEEITGRFMNVISLFNGAIPIIALQMTAVECGNEIMLVFTKVLDRITLGNVDEDIDAVATDRNYWNNNSTKEMMELLDKIFNDLKNLIGEYDLKYNKFYVGIAMNGKAKNFIYFRPKKRFIYLGIKGKEVEDTTNKLNNAELDFSYSDKGKQYEIRINKYDDYINNKELISKMVEEARKLYFDL